MIYKLLFILALTLIGSSSNEDVLEWQENVQLKWSDFKGEPKDLGDIVAITSSGISFRFSIKEGNGEVIGFDTQVQAHFYPKRSWVHKKKSSDHILAHEQLHFDITELHARKFKKEITQLNISKDIKRDLNSTYKRINKEMTVMQHSYDIESNYSRNIIMQAAWKIKIDDALKVYDDYKKHP
ncbi:DUF922 domain-containing protein [Gelidibacter pelagius]|uniref:DUF922 domain-containing protein n=1 Tax=Gelidibacter pelagius TaxID=2819985 RepID=A0ABS3SNI7_9FLAO|nr:DUF922 domain-containing protein [Gelidibacter pelagius]MBO3097280.1 DUF922 domain-containing protein [Gelidibacter pelagius]